MIIWEPDTCYCSIKTERPGVPGEFLIRCTLHKNARHTVVTYNHNKANKRRGNEYNGTGKEKQATQASIDRIDNLKRSTKP